MKSVVVDPKLYDWEGDTPLNHPSARTVIYEMHVRGFTQHPNSRIAANRRGTFAGVIDKIPYLRALGVTAVELMPVFQIDAQDAPPGLVNYWGYSPIAFFAPHVAYSSRHDPLGAIDEFRDMVMALHRAGMEVILDVVFNHTAEGDHTGPTFSFRGIDDATYYILDHAGAGYANYSGCGNTLNTNQPVVRRMIVDCLCYWVQEMHVDGYRFDLASVLSRDQTGHPIPDPPVLWDIETEPALAGTKLIAEAWDAAGLYQVGSFVGDAWKEWNGRFRLDVRDFVRGAPGSVRRVADRLLGSPAIYEHERREAEQSVNFVTCHDGFTLNDLVSYDHKHNEANGEQNRDGMDDNRSWNCGCEGPCADMEVESLRNRQIKNFLAITLLSAGMPMILMGDEVRRSQKGNNNAYCHDDTSNWFDWALVEKYGDIFRFTSQLCRRRTLLAADNEHNRISLKTMLSRGKITWHGVKQFQPDWSEWSHSIALSADLPETGFQCYLALNAYCEALEFELPKLAANAKWYRWVDTALQSPNDIADWQRMPSLARDTYLVQPRSMLISVTESNQTNHDAALR